MHGSQGVIHDIFSNKLTEGFMCLTVSNKIITIIQHPCFTQPVLSLDKGWMVVKWNEKFFTRFKIMLTEIMQFTIVKAATPCHTVLQVTPLGRESPS